MQLFTLVLAVLGTVRGDLGKDRWMHYLECQRLFDPSQRKRAWVLHRGRYIQDKATELYVPRTSAKHVLNQGRCEMRPKHGQGFCKLQQCESRQGRQKEGVVEATQFASLMG